MLGLVLQGGGAKGAYQAGAIRALIEEGIEFDGVVGTSIGAINAAMVAQQDYDLMYKLWSELDIGDVFDASEIPYIDQLINHNSGYTRKVYSVITTVTKVFRDRGIDMTKGTSLVSRYVNEQKIRASKIDFGLTTITYEGKKSVPVRLFKNDIPEGRLLEYIFASANFPLFKTRYIDGKKFRDGGFYDNLPITMLTNRGYDHIIAIRLGSSIAPIVKVDVGTTAQITYLDPSEKPGSVLDFRNAPIKKALLMGYYDTRRIYRKYKGLKYYIDVQDRESLFNAFIKLDDFYLAKMSSILEVPFSPIKVNYALAIIEKIGKLFDSKINHDANDILLSVAEHIAELIGIDRMRVYKLGEFFSIVMLGIMTEGSGLVGIKPSSKKKAEIAEILVSAIVEKL